MKMFSYGNLIPKMHRDVRSCRDHEKAKYSAKLDDLCCLYVSFRTHGLGAGPQSYHELEGGISNFMECVRGV